MGAQLALQAHGYANTHNIAPLPRVLLGYMALRALDADSETRQKAARSFMSRSELAVGINRMMADRRPSADASPEAHLEWDRDDQAVKRALAELKRAGAIRLVHTGHSGRVSEYEICLGAPPAGTQNVPQPGTENVPVGVRSVPERGVTERTPKEQEINQEEKQGGQQQITAPPHVQPVDKTSPKKDYPRPTPSRNTMPRSAVPGPFHGARRSPERVTV